MNIPFKPEDIGWAEQDRRLAEYRAQSDEVIAAFAAEVGEHSPYLAILQEQRERAAAVLADEIDDSDGDNAHDEAEFAALQGTVSMREELMRGLSDAQRRELARSIARLAEAVAATPTGSETSEMAAWLSDEQAFFGEQEGGSTHG